MKHGLGGYTNNRCRCNICRKALADYQKAARTRRAEAFRAGELEPWRHGDNSTYVNWGCRCEPCRAAHADCLRRYRSVVAS